LGDAVAEIGGADFGNGQAAGGDDHRPAAHGAALGVDLVAAIARHAQRLHAAGLPALHAAGGAFAQQHLNQVVGGAVAKQLAFVFSWNGTGGAA
jgi:hypothetical protein